jgi:hypothetical protein
MALDPDGFPLVPLHRRRTWYGLSWSEQRQVLRAARRGESHSDPAVAHAARTWAHEVPPPKEGARSLRSLLLALLSDPWGGTLGALLGDRRAARRILAARPPEPPGGVDGARS